MRRNRASRSSIDFEVVVSGAFLVIPVPNWLTIVGERACAESRTGRWGGRTPNAAFAILVDLHKKHKSSKNTKPPLFAPTYVKHRQNTEPQPFGTIKSHPESISEGEEDRVIFPLFLATNNKGTQSSEEVGSSFLVGNGRAERRHWISRLEIEGGWRRLAVQSSASFNGSGHRQQILKSGEVASSNAKDSDDAEDGEDSFEDRFKVCGNESRGSWMVRPRMAPSERLVHDFNPPRSSQTFVHSEHGCSIPCRIACDVGPLRENRSNSCFSDRISTGAVHFTMSIAYHSWKNPIPRTVHSAAAPPRRKRYNESRARLNDCWCQWRCFAT